MQHSQPPHHSAASTTDRFIQVGHFALHLHNPDEPTSVFFQVSHCVFRINFFTATLASYHASSSLFHNTTASGLHISTGNLCHIPRQPTALPLRRVTLSACHFSDNSPLQRFTSPTIHQSTASNCPCGTISQSTMYSVNSFPNQPSFHSIMSPVNLPQPFPVYRLPRHG